jgi:glycosyltransferase involved in cell wall biosynthesis
VAKPRILVLNQYYAPGLEATAQLLAALCEGLADEFDIHVVTGRLRGTKGGADSGRFQTASVTVERVHSTAFDRRRLPLRALNYVTFLVQSVRAALRSPRPDVVFCMTDPPIIANVALFVARRFRVPLVVVSQDVFPEVAVELNRLTNPVAVKLLRAAISHYLRRADHVVAIGETMHRRLQQKGARPERMTVIPNWVDTSFLTPQPRDNDWAREHGLADKFVVMHSGNVGHAQNLDALLRAFTFLRDLPDVRLVIIGDGARYVELTALAERLELGEQSLFLPYQPRSVLPASLSSADVHVVGLARGLSGYVVPSRLYGVLSVARTVIVAADEESETAQIVRRIGCGVVVPPARPDLLALAIRTAYERRDELAAQGARGRAYVTEEADVTVALARYRALLKEVVK